MQEKAGVKQTATSKKQAEVEGKTLFIPVEKLGALEQVVVEMTREHKKRMRQIEFNRIEHVLKGLHFLHWGMEVRSVALGCTKMGQVGLFVTFSVPEVQAAVQLPEVS